MRIILFFHVLGVILWMGTLFVVSRLLAEHAEHPAVGEILTRFETRLFGVIHGGAAFVIGSGILIVLEQPELLRQGWLHVKLLFVLWIVVLDVQIYRRMQALHGLPSSVSRRQFVGPHHMLGLALIVVVFLAVVRPF